MVLRAGNCLICLQNEHNTDSCFSKDQQKTLCGLVGCNKRHHPSLHMAPKSVLQACNNSLHKFEEIEVGNLNPGVLSLPENNYRNLSLPKNNHRNLSLQKETHRNLSLLEETHRNLSLQKDTHRNLSLQEKTHRNLSEPTNMNFKQAIQVHDEDIVAPSKLGNVGLHSKFVSRVSCKHSWIDTGSCATSQSYLEKKKV